MMRFTRDDEKKLFDAYKVLDKYINNPITTFVLFINGVEIKIELNDFIPLNNYFNIESQLKKYLSKVKFKQGE